MANARPVDWFPPGGALLARFRIGDHLGKIVMGIVERLHLGGAVVAFVARRDAFRVALQGIDDPGDGGRIAIANTAAIRFVGVRGDQKRERDQASCESMQGGFPPARSVRQGDSASGWMMHYRRARTVKIDPRVF
jgi:hypothetical protein